MADWRLAYSLQQLTAETREHLVAARAAMDEIEQLLDQTEG